MRGSGVAIVLLAGLTACTEEAPLPDLGKCAIYPDGIYEYGQIGVGTCLAGPVDLALLAGGDVLAVANANPWKDFTGGSALFLDLTALDYSTGRNLVSDIAIEAIDLPSFSGPMASAEDRGLLMVANRLSEDARTRESTDDLWFIDVSDPTAPVLADVAPDGATLGVGYDPNAVVYDEASGLAYVVNRTSHDVTMVDLTADPVEIVPPGGGDRLDADPFVDVDADGSRAAFVTLEPFDEEEEEVEVVAHVWSMRWSVGTVRAWVPTEGGLRRVTGNGAGTWLQSEVPLDLDLEDADEAFSAIEDPSFLLDDSVARMVFSDGTDLRAAYAPSTVEIWAFEDEALLSPRDDGWDAVIGGPSMVLSEDSWFLFYDGGDGETQAIGLAVSDDGAVFGRPEATPVVEVEGLSATDPVVLRDTEEDRWRMWFALSDGTLGAAVSDDLVSWEVLDERYAPADAVHAPSVARWGGRWHLVYAAEATDGTWSLVEATSVDGLAWTPVGEPFAVEGDRVPALALQVVTEDTFRVEDDTGEVFPISVIPGEDVGYQAGGWKARVAVGHVVDPEDFDADGVELGSVVGETAWLTVTTGDEGSIVAASRVGDAWVADAEPAITAADVDVDSVGAPVVVETADGWRMYFARTEGGVTAIGRATSADGITWDVDAAPILEGVDSWESVAMEPASVDVADDGTLRLWYAGYDGSRWRVGVAESDDGESFTRVSGAVYAWQFETGVPGTWTDSGVRHPYVLRDGDVERLWFSGYDGTAWQVGYAERAAGEDEFTVATDADGEPRPVIEYGTYFGVDGVQHPVVAATDGGWELWYTGVDDDAGRVGRAVAYEADRVARDLRLPGLDDTWGFTVVPGRDEESIVLDTTVDGSELMGIGCSALAKDEERGFLYVGCKLSPWFYVVDVRDDSTDDFEDLNYLDVEAAVWIETSTNSCTDLTEGQCSGLRALMVDAERGWLWGLADEPEALYAIDLAGIPDDGQAELVREEVVAMLPLPRSGERDEGVNTQAYVGPAQLAMHPDGHHLFVTNFNDNSVSVFDLALGASGTLVGEARDLGENPYAIRVSDDGTRAYVAFYAGEVETGGGTSSTLGVLDADPASPTFLMPLTWVVNR